MGPAARAERVRLGGEARLEDGFEEEEEELLNNAVLERRRCVREPSLELAAGDRDGGGRVDRRAE